MSGALSLTAWDSARAVYNFSRELLNSFTVTRIVLADVKNLGHLFYLV